MNCVIQRASGRQAILLAQLVPTMSLFCKAHGLEYRPGMDTKPSTRPFWERYSDLVAWLETATPGEVCVLLDADAVWVWPYVNICSALADADDLGVVVGRDQVLHTGAIYVRASEDTLNLFTKMLRGEAVGPGGLLMASSFGREGYDVEYFNQEVTRSKLKLAQLPPRWNNWPQARGPLSDRTIVRAWHGAGLQCKLNSAIKLSTTLKRVFNLYDRGIPATELRELEL